MSKKVLTSMILGLTVALGCVAPALADSRKVVTLGADLSPEQQQKMLRYFGVNTDAVDIIYINNDDEREHLGAYVPLEQIGTKTFSCALVAPTRTGGIQVKTANLNWVTCNMIASTLSTSGVKNCQVVAASPFEVSGTGALTGCIMAYEEAMNQAAVKIEEEPEYYYDNEIIVLEPVKVQLANEELITTANLSDEVGPSKATAVINATKLEVIENNITDITEITNIVNNVSNIYDVDISSDQSEQIAELMAKIAEQDYDITQLKATLERVQANVAGDAGASEEVQKELEEAAKKSEEAALEAIEEEYDDGFVVFDDEEDEEGSILDFTDISALEEDGFVVTEGDTTSSVIEQEEDNDTITVDDDNDDIFGEDDDEDETDAIGEDEVDVPAVEEKLTKEDLDFEDLEIYEDIEDDLRDVFTNDQVTSENGEVVYLTSDASKDLQKAVQEYVLKVLVKGADAVAAEESKDDHISQFIVDETAYMAEDKNYEDDDLVQIDKFVRRAVLKDSEKILKDCGLTEDDVVLVYEEIIAVLEEAFGVEKEELIEEVVIDDVEGFAEEFDEDIDEEFEDEFADFMEEEETFE